MSSTIEITGYDRGSEGSGRLAEALELACRLAKAGEVTYVTCLGDVTAAITPPEAGERYEHANLVEVFPGARHADLSGLALTSAPAGAAQPLYKRVLRGLFS